MIYVTGDIIIDEYLYGNTTRISPEAPVPIVDLISREKRWGGCGNVWKNIAAILPLTKLACYWDDVNKDLFYNDQTNFWLPKIDKIPLKTRIMSNGRYMSRIDDEEFITDTVLQDTIFNQWNDIQKTDTVVLSDYNKGSIKNPEKFIADCKGRVLVDPKLKLDRYKGAYLIKPNLKEFEEYVGKINSPKELMTKAQLTRDHLELTYLVITLSEDGVLLVGDTIEHYPSVVKEVSDVTGAGDVFMAGLALGLEYNKPISESTRLANTLAGLSVSKTGTYTITKTDFDSTLEELK
jgi:D-beta-D-heptose 7-phosphate kinase/D-beta-D-heptose 1-phosphate adenosyltransferase